MRDDDYYRKYNGAGCLVCWECFNVTWINDFQTAHDHRYLSGMWSRRMWCCLKCGDSQ